MINKFFNDELHYDAEESDTNENSVGIPAGMPDIMIGGYEYDENYDEDDFE